MVSYHEAGYLLGPVPSFSPSEDIDENEDEDEETFDD